MPGIGDEEVWRQLITSAMSSRPQPLVAHTFHERLTSYNEPVRLTCDDGQIYVVKGSYAGRTRVADQIVGRLGLLLGAPVAPVTLVDVPWELVEIEPELVDIGAGLAHGSLQIDGCRDADTILYSDQQENRKPPCAAGRPIWVDSGR